MTVEIQDSGIRSKISSLSVFHMIFAVVSVLYGMPMLIAPRDFFSIYGHPYKLTEFECYLARCHGIMLMTLATFNFSRASTPAYQWIVGSIAPLVGVIGLGLSEAYAHFLARGLVKKTEPAQTMHLFIGPVLFGVLTLFGLYNLFFNAMPIGKHVEGVKRSVTVDETNEEKTTKEADEKKTE